MAVICMASGHLRQFLQLQSLTFHATFERFKNFADFTLGYECEENEEK